MLFIKYNINNVNNSDQNFAVELKWLEDLLVLLEERSISRAAVRRHVTQPAYSRRIRQLEQWLGVELVDRSTKPIKIRDSALALEDGVRELVNGFYAMRNRVHETAERVTFVAQHTLAISRFPMLIRGIKQSLPQVSYRVVPVNYEECEALFYGEADLLLCYQSASAQLRLFAQGGMPPGSWQRSIIAGDVA